MELKKRSRGVLFFGAVLVIGLIVGIWMFGWATVEVNNCKAVNSCLGGEGLGQGGVILFVSIPAVLISFFGSIALYFLRKNKSLPISTTHKVLLFTDLILFVTACYFLRNYIRDVVELILGI